MNLSTCFTNGVNLLIDRIDFSVSLFEPVNITYQSDITLCIERFTNFKLNLHLQRAFREIGFNQFLVINRHAYNIAKFLEFVNLVNIKISCRFLYNLSSLMEQAQCLQVRQFPCSRQRAVRGIPRHIQISLI